MGNLKNRFHALIPCGGSGQRFGGEIPKQYRQLAGLPMVHHTILPFLAESAIDSVWVAVSADDVYLTQGKFEWPESSKLHVEQTGGDSRQATVLNTLKRMMAQGFAEDDWVLVHDAARPGIQGEQIHDLIDLCSKMVDFPGAILAVPVADTLKRQDLSARPETPKVLDSVPRDHLWQAQTPQMFRLGKLHQALEQAMVEDTLLTDEASAMERLGIQPLLVQGSVKNFKVTYEHDFALMEKVLSMKQTNSLKTSLRIGQGYDVHQLVPGRPLILGGVTIENDKGLLGHSDADALLHALIDAILGAVGAGDIGTHFPDHDPKYKGSNSLELLANAYEHVKSLGYEIVNLDSTIICQSPKLAGYIPQMVKTIADRLNLLSTQVNVKAKTNEGLGYLGEGKAIATQAIALMRSNT